MNKYDKIAMLNNLSPHYYSIFECVSDGEIKVMEEKDLLNY